MDTNTNSKIDITNANIQRLKLEDLYADAYARDDAAAVQWLDEKAMTEIEVPTKDGGTKKKYLSVNSYRVEYLEKFCGYVKTTVKRETAKDKREKMLAAIRAKAQSTAAPKEE